MPELVHRGIWNEGGVARLGHPLVTKLGVVDVWEPVDEGLQPQTVGILAVPVLHLAGQQRPDGRPEHWPRLSELVSALHRHLLAPTRSGRSRGLVRGALASPTVGVVEGGIMVIFRAGISETLHPRSLLHRCHRSHLAGPGGGIAPTV